MASRNDVGSEALRGHLRRGLEALSNIGTIPKPWIRN